MSSVWIITFALVMLGAHTWFNKKLKKHQALMKVRTEELNRLLKVKR